MIRWPDEQARRQRLSLAGGPRLLLVENGATPPPVLDCLEDWIRVPAAEDEVQARVDALATRRAAHDHDAPGLDAHGVLRFRGCWVSLPPLETRMLDALLTRFGAATMPPPGGDVTWGELDLEPGRRQRPPTELALPRVVPEQGEVSRP